MSEDFDNEPQLPDPLPPPGTESRLKRALGSFREKTKGPGTGLHQRLQNIDYLELAGWASRVLQTQRIGNYGKLFTILVCTYFLGSLAALLASGLIPEPPTARPSFQVNVRHRTLDDYNIISMRDLFNHEGKIPGEEATGNATDLGGTPTKTTLPFDLVGTLILEDEMRSVATIEDKSASMVYPVRVDDEIPAKAKILKIEARRVIFLNTASGRREYVDLPEEENPNNPKITLGTTGGAGGGGAGIERVAPTQFNVSRAEVDKTFADLNSVLTQARAVPHFQNGQPDGYQLFQIVPNSIYEKLGLVNGDIIKGINGQPITDPGQAFAMLSEFKNASHLDLTITRDGRTSSFSYDIH